jgi:hypothetical protein
MASGSSQRELQQLTVMYADTRDTGERARVNWNALRSVLSQPLSSSVESPLTGRPPANSRGIEQGRGDAHTDAAIQRS